MFLSQNSFLCSILFIILSFFFIFNYRLLLLLQGVTRSRKTKSVHTIQRPKEKGQNDKQNTAQKTILAKEHEPHQQRDELDF
jgi:hypothetical protein